VPVANPSGSLLGKSLPEEQIQYSRRFAKLGGFLEKFHRHQDFSVYAKSPTKLLGWKSSSGRITQPEITTQ
jgi:hypothetical protein